MNAVCLTCKLHQWVVSSVNQFGNVTSVNPNPFPDVVHMYNSIVNWLANKINQPICWPMYKTNLQSFYTNEVQQEHQKLGILLGPKSFL